VILGNLCFESCQKGPLLLLWSHNLHLDGFLVIGHIIEIQIITRINKLICHFLMRGFETNAFAKGPINSSSPSPKIPIFCAPFEKNYQNAVNNQCIIRIAIITLKRRYNSNY